MNRKSSSRWLMVKVISLLHREYGWTKAKKTNSISPAPLEQTWSAPSSHCSHGLFMFARKKKRSILFEYLCLPSNLIKIDMVSSQSLFCSAPSWIKAYLSLGFRHQLWINIFQYICSKRPK